jgi:hypothetical protein
MAALREDPLNEINSIARQLGVTEFNTLVPQLMDFIDKEATTKYHSEETIFLKKVTAKDIFNVNMSLVEDLYFLAEELEIEL